MPRISVKEQVLTILNENRGNSYSGQDLADEIGVSRTAVWKAINLLREEGYSISGSTKLGYVLDEDTDVLDKKCITDMLSKEAKDFYNIECVKIISSTNDEVGKRGMASAKEGLCIVAEEQTAGKGRKGRSFFSPGATGLYLSILLRPNMSFEDAVLITTAASVAAAKACEKTNTALEDGDVGIKWVNDLFLNGKKISGILTEANLDMETSKLDFAVMGIGFNLAPPKGEWPKDIENTAGSLFENELVPGSRNVLTAAFLDYFLDIYKDLPNVTYLTEYRKRSVAIGKMVNVMDGAGNKREAEVVGIDDRCQLIVRFKDEICDTVLNSGEISIKL